MELAFLASVGHEQQFHLRELCGRTAWLAEIDAWIASASAAESGGRVLVVTGGPGAGKSAVAAEIARRHDAALHMMKSHRSPARFVGSLVRQLADQAHAAPRTTTSGDVDDLRNALVDALEALAVAQGSALVVIDGLDELDDDVALDVLPRHLPPRTRVLLTARPEQPLLRRLRLAIGGLEEKAIPPLTRPEIAEVLARRAGRPLEPELTERVADATGGLPLLVRHAGDALRDPAAQDRVALPRTLADFAAEAHRAIRGVDDDAEVRSRVFQLLCSAREALGPVELASILALEDRLLTPERCRAHLEGMSGWLTEPRAGAWVPFHQSLVDFVRRDVLGEEGVRATERLLARWASGPDAGAYGVRHRVAHLVAAGDRDAAREDLERSETLLAKLQHGLVFELVRELDLTGSALAPRIRRHAPFLARHPYALSGLVQRARPPETVGLRALRPATAAASAATELFVLRGHDGDVYAASISPDGARIASASADATLRIWETASGSPIRTVAIPARRALSVAFSPDGRRIACGTDGAGVIVFDDRGDEVCRAGSAEIAWCVAYAPDGRLAIGGRSGGVEICDADGAVVARFESDGVVTALAFSRDGARVAAGTTRGKIAVANAAGSVLFRAGPIEDTPWALVWTPDGTLVAACADGVVREWSDAGVPGRERVVPDDRLWAAALSDDGELLVLGGKRGLLHAVAPDDPDATSTTAHEGEIHAIARGADDLVVTASSDRTVRGFRASALRASSPEARRPDAIALSPDGSVIATGHYDGAIRVLRVGDGGAPVVTARMPAHTSRVNRVAFSRDGALLATASQDATAKVFRVAPLLAPDGKRTPVADLVGHDGAVTAVAVVGSGGRVITAGRDRTARVWSVFGSRPLQSLSHDDTVIAVAADEMGELGATLDRGGALALFRLDDGAVVARSSIGLGSSVPTLAFPAPGVVRVMDHLGQATVLRLVDGALRKVELREARAHLPKLVLRSDPRWQESVLVDASNGRAVDAFPGLLALAAASDDGEHFAGWWAGDLQILSVERG